MWYATPLCFNRITRNVDRGWGRPYICKGTASEEMWKLFPRLRSAGVLHLDIKAEMQAYSWPRHHRTGSCVNAWSAFDDKRRASCKDAKSFKTGAAEALAIFPVLLEFAARYQAHLPAELAYFSKLCQIIDTILAMKHRHVKISANSCRLLQDSIEDHFARHMELYGKSHIVPKWHGALHLPQQFLKDNIVFDTLANEREHLNCRAIGDSMKGNMHAFELIVLTPSISFHLQRVQSFSEFGSLDGRTLWSEEFGAELGSAINFNGMHVALKEFVVWRRQVLYVHCFGRAAGELFVVGVACKVFKCNLSWRYVVKVSGGHEGVEN